MFSVEFVNFFFERDKLDSTLWSLDSLIKCFFFDSTVVFLSEIFFNEIDRRSISIRRRN